MVFCSFFFKRFFQPVFLPYPEPMYKTALVLVFMALLLYEKRGATSFEICRSTLNNIFCNRTSWKDRPEIVDVRTKTIDLEVTYWELLQDLYISFLEDCSWVKGNYYERVAMFKKWYSELPEGKDHWLIENLVLIPLETRGPAAKELKEKIEQIRLQWFEGEYVREKIL